MKGPRLCGSREDTSPVKATQIGALVGSVVTNVSDGFLQVDNVRIDGMEGSCFRVRLKGNGGKEYLKGLKPQKPHRVLPGYTCNMADFPWEKGEKVDWELDCRLQMAECCEADDADTNQRIDRASELYLFHKKSVTKSKVLNRLLKVRDRADKTVQEFEAALEGESVDPWSLWKVKLKTLMGAMSSVSQDLYKREDDHMRFGVFSIARDIRLEFRDALHSCTNDLDTVLEFAANKDEAARDFYRARLDAFLLLSDHAEEIQAQSQPTLWSNFVDLITCTRSESPLPIEMTPLPLGDP